MINFVGKKKIFFVISIVLVLGICLFALVGGIPWDLQFQGGTIATITYEGDVDHVELQGAIEESLGGRVALRDLQDAEAGTRSISISSATTVEADRFNSLVDTLNSQFSDHQFTLEEVHAVNAAFDTTFFVKGLAAVAVACLLVILYFALRFRKIGGWSAGLTAVLAALHNGVVALGILVLCRGPLNLYSFAAILAVLAYTAGSTAFLFDRVRENQQVYGKKISACELVNNSINQSLRGMVVSNAVVMVALAAVCVVAWVNQMAVVALILFPLLMGVAATLYTSTCIVGPLWAVWKGHGHSKKAAA